MRASPVAATPVPSLGPRGPVPNAPLRQPLDRRWLHYAFLSRRPGHAVIANLSVLGAEGDRDEPRPAPERRAILLVHERGRGWASSQFNAEEPDLPWSSFRLPHHRKVAGPFRVAARTGRPSVDLRLRRTSTPCTSQCATFDVEEHLRWQSEPGILATGSLRADHDDVGVDLLGYHERVRGRWSWPALGGWVFGFANDPAGDPNAPPPAAVVFTLIQPLSPPDGANGSVMLWRDGRLLRHFPRRCLRVAVQDFLDRDRVVLVPPLAGLFGTTPMAGVPRRLLITAYSGADRLVIDFRADTAARIANPSETSLLPFSVHEALGHCVVESRVSGRQLDFETMGIVEFAGGAGDR